METIRMKELKNKKVLGDQKYQAEIFDFDKHENGCDKAIAIGSENYTGTIDRNNM